MLADITDFDIPARAIAGGRFERFRAVSRDYHDFLDPAGSEPGDDSMQDWFAADFEHRLGGVRRESAEASATAGRKQHRPNNFGHSTDSPSQARTSNAGPPVAASAAAITRATASGGHTATANPPKPAPVSRAP